MNDYIVKHKQTLIKRKNGDEHELWMKDEHVIPDESGDAFLYLVVEISKKRL